MSAAGWPRAESYISPREVVSSSVRGQEGLYSFKRKFNVGATHKNKVYICKRLRLKKYATVAVGVLYKT